MPVMLLFVLGLEIGGIKLVEPVFAPETLYYTIQVGGKTKGTYTCVLSKEKYKEKEALKFNLITVTGEDTSAFYDTVILYVDPVTLAPLYSQRKMAGKIKAKITAQYEKNKAKVHLETSMGSKEIDINIPQGSVDNEEITYIFRWIDLKGPKSGTLTDVTPSGGTTLKIKWEFKGDTLITIGEKNFKVYQVELNFLGRKVDMFYEKELPRRMIKYMDLSSGTEMVLRMD